MTVIMQQTMPEGTTLEFLDEVTQQMGVETDPPAGLVVHTHFVEGGHVQIVDVWDSQEAYERFEESLLGPTLERVAAKRGLDMSQAPPGTATFMPVGGLVKGR
jgi:hypothetical protein